ELREAFVLLVGHDARPEQRDHVVADVSVARPHLGAVDPIAAVDLLGTRADRGEVRARVRLAHAGGERPRAAPDARQEALALLLRPEAQEQRAALPVGEPVGRDRGPCRQHLLQYDVAPESRPLVAAVLLGPYHPDPSAGTHLPAELAVEPAPRPGALVR